MGEFKKYFSVDEAKALVPEIKRRFETITQLLAEIKAEQEKSGAPMVLHRGNGKGPIVEAKSDKVATVQREIEEVAAMGIVIKDVQRGLIDFPHQLNDDPNHIVLLCFLVAEDTVRYYHELEAGFAGRTEL